VRDTRNGNSRYSTGLGGGSIERMSDIGRTMER